MDFKKFYLSPEGRANRKQFWLWLVLPLTAIEILLVLVDVATKNYNPELGIGLFSGIFALVAVIPTVIVYIKRFGPHRRPIQAPRPPRGLAACSAARSP